MILSPIIRKMLERRVLETLHPTTHLFLNRNGITYVVHEGPPWPKFSEAENIFGNSEEPHVFEVTDFSLTADHDSQTLVGVTDSSLRVLNMHGIWRDNNWYPQGTRYQKNGITIPGIVEDYESATGKKIDVIAACTGYDPSIAEKVFFAEPKIHMLRGPAIGATFTRFDTGELSLTMHVDHPDSVQYLGWLNQKREKMRNLVSV